MNSNMVIKRKPEGINVTLLEATAARVELPYSNNNNLSICDVIDWF
jgi:hypothetical protein